MTTHHPATITQHLADRTTTPILTSARTPARRDALAALTATALTSHDAALRLGLGAPQHVVVEFAAGPVQLVSYLHPAGARRRRGSGSGSGSGGGGGTSGAATTTAPASPAAAAEAPPRALLPAVAAGPLNGLSLPLSPLAGTGGLGLGGGDEEDEGAGTAPMLLALVLAPSTDELPTARRAMARMEHLGRNVQAEWAAEEDESREGTEAGE